MTPYESAREVYPAADGNLHFAAAQTTATIETVKSASHQIFVKRITVWIKTDAAQSITFQDDNASPVIVCKVPASPGVDTRWDFDFAGTGVPLTLGKSLTATFSAAGLAGHMQWEGFQKD